MQPAIKNLAVILLLITSQVSFSQINLPDSSVQAITYWEKGDQQHYTISQEKIKIKGTDTTSREKTTYDVEVSVLKADKTSYTVQWHYKNIVSSNSSPLVQKIMGITRDMTVIFTTDELGAFVEVVNWKEISDYIHQSMAVLKQEYKAQPELDNMIRQVETTFTSKEAIESAAIKDIIQFHTFYGAKYRLGQLYEGTLKAPNIFGGEPFDSEFSAYLDEINTEDNNYILRASEIINNEQLLNATLSYLNTLAKSMNVPPPGSEDLKDLKNETLTAARIHNTGWVIYSIQTRTITIDDTTNVEERIISIH